MTVKLYGYHLKSKIKLYIPMALIYNTYLNITVK